MSVKPNQDLSRCSRMVRYYYELRLDTTMNLINKKNNLQTQFPSFHINLPTKTHQLILLGEKLLGLSRLTAFLMSHAKPFACL